MKIHFFEEFPDKSSLRKIRYVNWKSTIYVAARSVREFKSVIKNHTQKGITFAWWPILTKKEGYWLSPFSSPNAVKRVINDAVRNNVQVMWDAELPFRHPLLFLRIDNFLRNKRTIPKFFKKHGKKIVTAEYPVKNRFVHWIFKRMGVSFSPQKYRNTKIVMYYTSMHRLIPSFLLSGIEGMHKLYGRKLHVALGTIATGVVGNEPILSPKKLERDLNEMKKIGVKDVVIFRLGGMNERYRNVLETFAR
jgi:hypothetical protein